MGKAVLIMGKSGSGKSFSMKNLPPDSYSYINVMNKPLSFRSNKKGLATRDYDKITDFIHQAVSEPVNKKTIIIDDANYLMTDDFMKNAYVKGYQKFTDLAKRFYDLIEYVNSNNVPDDVIVYVMMHEEESDFEVKPKTIGKMLNEKVCIEGMFTIVLRCMTIDGEHTFLTQTNGNDVTKTPYEMFSEDRIPNDLNLVSQVINDYYGGE